MLQLSHDAAVNRRGYEILQEGAAALEAARAARSLDLAGTVVGARQTEAARVALRKRGLDPDEPANEEALIEALAQVGELPDDVVTLDPGPAEEPEQVVGEDVVREARGALAARGVADPDADELADAMADAYARLVGTRAA